MKVKLSNGTKKLCKVKYKIVFLLPDLVSMTRKKRL